MDPCSGLLSVPSASQLPCFFSLMPSPRKMGLFISIAGNAIFPTPQTIKQQNTEVQLKRKS